MKQLTHFIALTAIAFLLTACGESTTDEPVPEGTAPSDPVADREVEPGVDPQPMTEHPALDPDPEPDPEATTPPPLPLPVADDDAERGKAPGISYVLPEGWTVGPKKTMRLLTLLPPAEFVDAELAVSHWPRGVGDFSSNVLRWANQAGVQFVKPPARNDYEQFKIDDITATWVAFSNQGTDFAILAAWVPIAGDSDQPSNVWIFKLNCKDQDVEALATAVRAWCESVKFE